MGGGYVAVRRGPNHGLHLVLTLITCGMWAPVWILVVILDVLNRKWMPGCVVGGSGCLRVVPKVRRGGGDRSTGQESVSVGEVGQGRYPGHRDFHPARPRGGGSPQDLPMARIDPASGDCAVSVPARAG